MSSALVLAGGGVAGIAWELGFLTGLADADPDLAARVIRADLVVGTSAGSTVAAQVTSGVPLEELYAAQQRPATTELEPGVALEELFALIGARLEGVTDPGEVRRQIGAIGLEASTVTEAERLGAVRGRLPSQAWPEQRVAVVAMDAATGDRVVLDASSGVPLESAVAASCAIPGIWPPVTLGDRRLVDGGVWSGANADLAAGHDRVLVLVPSAADEPPAVGASLDSELPALGEARVLVVHADTAAVASYGGNPLDLTTRGAAAAEGRRQGRAAAPEVASLLA